MHLGPRARILPAALTSRTLAPSMPSTSTSLLLAGLQRHLIHRLQLVLLGHGAEGSREGTVAAGSGVSGCSEDGKGRIHREKPQLGGKEEEPRARGRRIYQRPGVTESVLSPGAGTADDVWRGIAIVRRLTGWELGPLSMTQPTPPATLAYTRLPSSVRGRSAACS